MQLKTRDAVGAAVLTVVLAALVVIIVAASFIRF